MSELANCCEYLTSEKLCLAVSDSEKAKVTRQVRCKNEEKMTCCYLCLFVLDCATPCRFLGSFETESPQIDAEKTRANKTLVSNEKPEEDKTRNATVTCCSLCNVEMLQTRTKFRIDGWAGSHQKLADDDSGKLGEEFLSVIVCLCPKCGKIDFRADEETK